MLVRLLWQCATKYNKGKLVFRYRVEVEGEAVPVF